jgi:hypothetical protein
MSVGIVWREIQRQDGRRLVPAAGGDPDFLAATVAYALKLYGANGFVGATPSPLVEDTVRAKQYNRVVELLAREDVAAGRFNDRSLPKRAVLWPVVDGKPIATERLPASAQWILKPGVEVESDYVAEGDDKGQRYRLYVSQEPPEGAGYISQVSGTGVPLAPKEKSTWHARVLAGAGALLFIWVAMNISQTANSYSQAYDLLAGKHPEEEIVFRASIHLPDCTAEEATSEQQALCLTEAERAKELSAEEKKKAEAARTDAEKQQAEETAKDLKTANQEAAKKQAIKLAKVPQHCLGVLVAVGKLQTAAQINAQNELQKKQTGPCLKYVLTPAVQHAGRYMVITQESTLGRWLQNVNWYLFSWHLPQNDAQQTSLVTPLILMMVSVLVVLIGLGRNVEKKWLGALISPENRYSLALAQVTSWTVLVLTCVMGIAIFNGGLVGEQLRGVKAGAAYGDGMFPTLHPGIWAVLGITFASTGMSTLIKNLRGTVPESILFDVRGADGNAVNPGGAAVTFFQNRIVARDDTRKATLADWFLGEEAANKDRIDISRVQMVLITAGLLVTYGEMIFGLVRDLSAPAILNTISEVGVLIPALPPVGASMGIMLAVSHATYLISKAADVAKPNPGENKPAPPGPNA